MSEDPESLTSPDTGPPRIAQHPPRALAWTAVVVCAAAAVMVVWGAWRTGIAVDEPFHVFRLRNLFDTGWYLLDDDFDGAVPGSWVTDQYVYAPITTLLMHGVCVLLGIEDPGVVSTSSGAYGTRHLVVGVLGLLGAGAVAATGRLVLRSWGWGVVAAGTLLAIPMWPGLSMFDLKDVPAATGYTLITLGLVMSMRSSPGRPWMRAATVATLVAGVLLAVGTRPGLWTGLAIGVAVVLVSSFRRSETGRITWETWRLAELAVALVVAYALLWWAYPAMFSRPDRWILSSAISSSSYSPTNLNSWAYIPSRVGATMPPLMLILGAVGCVAALRERRGRWSPHDTRVSLIACQALALPVLAMVRESPLYDDLRQVLFACPAVALLLTLGTRHLVNDLRRSGRVAWRVGVGLWAAALAVPLVVQLQLFPYNYAYASPQADLIGAPTDNDFWRTSFRELLPQVPLDEFVMCSPATTVAGLTLRFTTVGGRSPAEASTDCRRDPISPLTPYLGPLAVEDGTPGATFTALFERGDPPGENCESLGTVSRQRYFSTQTVSTVARCELVLKPYPSGGTETLPDGTGATYLLGGWTSHPADRGVRLREPLGSLGFELPERWASASLRVRLEGAATGLPDLRVNDRSVSVEPDDAGWSAEVPADVVASMGERRLVITLGPARPGEALTLTHVSLEAA